jgi:NADH dehydrogenase
LGVAVRTRTLLAGLEDGQVTLQDLESGRTETMVSQTVLWAAGAKASPLGRVLAQRTGVEIDRLGRVMVGPDLSIPGRTEIYVIGDMAHFKDEDGQPLPGVAQVAMQQGAYAAELILGREKGQEQGAPFRYQDKGSLAVIGRNAAVADLGFARFGGFLAWLIWIFIHISYLIGFDNKLLVLTQWAWNYFTRNRGARLITGADPFPLVEARSAEAEDVLDAVSQQPEPARSSG